MEDSLPKDSLYIAKERLRAQMAMEGEERRKKREEAARKAKQAEEQAKKEEGDRKRAAFEKEKIEKEKKEGEIRAAEERGSVSREIQKQVEEVRGGGGGLRTIRTLKNDQAELINRQNISVIGMAIKEDERRRKEGGSRSLSSGKNLLTIVASIIFIALGAGASFYVYQFYYAPAEPGITAASRQLPAPILFTDKSVTFDATGLSPDNLLSKIRNEVENPPDLLLGAVENFVLTKKDAAGLEVPLATREFFNTIGVTPPDSLSRTLSNEYMFGILSSAENAGFIILKTEAYDKGLAGLLDWEAGTMTKDLYQLLAAKKPSQTLLAKPFEDLLLRNIDTRVLKDESGAARIVYGFIDGDKTIAIAGSQQAFIEAANRFNTPQPVVR